MVKSDNPFRYFNSSAEVIRLVVRMYVKYLLSLRDAAVAVLGGHLDVEWEALD